MIFDEYIFHWLCHTYSTNINFHTTLKLILYPKFEKFIKYENNSSNLNLLLLLLSFDMISLITRLSSEMFFVLKTYKYYTTTLLSNITYRIYSFTQCFKSILF